jgi:predicted phage terminase large subunit-like protein
MNLEPVRSKEEARSRGQRGGYASGDARRKKRRLREYADILLSLPVADWRKRDKIADLGIPDDAIDNRMFLITSLMNKALKGDVAAFKEIQLMDNEIERDNISELQKRKYGEAYASLWEYCKLKADKFYTEDANYLWEICDAMQSFLRDDNELLVINMPPRFGKSRTASLASQWYLGRDKTLKLIVASYNEKLSRRFSKIVRNDIQEVKSDINRVVFSDIFPNINIKFGSATVDLWGLDGNAEDNFLATSPDATMTGFGADLIIIDDIVKNAYEANHKQLLEDHFEWFTDTLYSRLEGKAKVMLIMTRWATKDLAGRVISMYQEQGRKYRLISKKAFDGVKMLNERVLNKERYDNLIQTIGEDIVRANYDQEPIDLKGRLYGEFITYKDKPQFKSIHSVCDTADEGGDYLCNIIYGLTAGGDPKAYVIDAYYTQEPMEKTENTLVEKFIEHKVEQAVFESNFGGKAFVRNIERLSVDAGNKKTLFVPYTQTKNKEARILSNATNVTRGIYMPEYWNKLFPQFYRDVTEYQRTGKNEHDDAPDCLTAICERDLSGTVSLIGQR